MRHMPCPLCDGTETHPISRCDDNGAQLKTSFHFIFGVKFLTCGDCGFVYSDYIEPAILDFYYRKMCRRDASEADLVALRDSARKNGLSQLEYLAPYLPERLGRVLDFGGGAGEAARLYVDRAERVYITEKDARYSAELRADPDLEFIEDDVLDGDAYNGFFDLVIHSNTLEHMQFPVYQLARLSRVISRDGLLFIEIPNEAEAAASHNLYGRQHVVFFSEATARLLVENQGSFDLLDLRTSNQPLSDWLETRVMKWQYERQHTEDGRTIRMVLRNTQPAGDVTAPVMPEHVLADAYETLSDNLFEMSEILGKT